MSAFSNLKNIRVWNYISIIISEFFPNYHFNNAASENFVSGTLSKTEKYIADTNESEKNWNSGNVIPISWELIQNVRDQKTGE